MKRQEKDKLSWEMISKSRSQKLASARTLDTPETYSRGRLSKISMLGFEGGPSFLFRRGFKIPRYQNTYRLEPFKAFHAVAVDKIIHDIMETKLSVITSYQPEQTSKLCLEIAADVLKATCKKDYDRCKLVTQVYIIQRFQQSIHAAFQCLWDVEHDNYSYHVFENNHIYAWCCVFGIYYD